MILHLLHVCIIKIMVSLANGKWVLWTTKSSILNPKINPVDLAFLSIKLNAVKANENNRGDRGSPNAKRECHERVPSETH